MLNEVSTLHMAGSVYRFCWYSAHGQCSAVN